MWSSHGLSPRGFESPSHQHETFCFPIILIEWFIIEGDFIVLVDRGGEHEEEAAYQGHNPSIYPLSNPAIFSSQSEKYILYTYFKSKTCVRLNAY